MNATLSLSDAAEQLGVHYMTAYRYVRLGMLPAVRRGGQWSVTPEAIAGFAARPPARPGRRRVVGSRGPRGSRHPDQRTVARLADRLLQGDEAGAWAILDKAQASGRSVDAVAFELVGPAMEHIGDGWAVGDVTIAREHIATGVASRVWARVGTGARLAGRRWGVAVVAAPTGEQHALPVTMVADLLRRRGLEVVDVGVDCPPAEIADVAADQDRLVGVGLGLTSALTPARVEQIRETCRRVHAQTAVEVLVGGAAVGDRETAVGLGADAWSADAPAALRWFEVKRTRTGRRTSSAERD